MRIIPAALSRVSVFDFVWPRSGLPCSFHTHVFHTHTQHKQMFQGNNATPSPEGGTGDEETARVAIDNPFPQGGSSRERRRSNQINKLSPTGKFALVLFYDMNSCVQYKVSTTWLFYLTLVCLYWLPLHIICTNICYNLLSFIIINCDNAHLPVLQHTLR